MNRKIGVVAAAVNGTMVLCFAASMLAGSLFFSYLSSFFIALSFVPMMCAYCAATEESGRTAGGCAVAFGAMYALCNALVYFTQITTVRLGGLSQQAAALLDFQQFGLLFQWDLLGYALMSAATFFAGLTLSPATRTDRWLKNLLLIHGVFAAGCLLLPVLGVFRPGLAGAEWVGTVVLEFWCAYFLPISALSLGHFWKSAKTV